MKTTVRVTLIVLGCIMAASLPWCAFSDSVYRVDRAKGMSILVVDTTMDDPLLDVPIYGLRVYTSKGSFNSFSAPNGWSVGYDPAYGDRGIVWQTMGEPIPAGGALAGFGVKKAGGGDVGWQTVDLAGNVIEWGWLSLKGH